MSASRSCDASRAPTTGSSPLHTLRFNARLTSGSDLLNDDSYPAEVMYSPEGGGGVSLAL
jgi:hypothetical protein